MSVTAVGSSYEASTDHGGGWPPMFERVGTVGHDAACAGERYPLSTRGRPNLPWERAPRGDQ
ncbi:hypothetical protein [Salinactinospora qingdaonensis]|uniref:Uncharacterized protein n=1 Tax=Salinactinospora qingdaonensis TaxID=702744 RepID=A0ABP7GKB4_9ACTN